MRYYRFLQQSALDDMAWADSTGINHFSLTEADGTTWFYLPFNSPAEAEDLLARGPFLRYEVVEVNEYVDWGVQWFGTSSDYTLEIDLSRYGDNVPSLHLKAGPGFGDLSHPTTRLTLAMMAPHVQGKEVIDVGCGSGILTLAAVLLGASFAYGLDIDLEALKHANENAILNALENCVLFSTPDRFTFPSEDAVVLMNMIRSQQREALKQLALPSSLYITSGILATEREDYLKECEQREWLLLEERTEGDWMGCIFTHS